MAFAAVLAIAGGAEVTAALALSAVAEVGTAMAVVGAVTGSKDLMKVGAIMGLVGGIGGMMAGAAGDTAALAADAATNPASAGAVNGMDSMSDAFSASGSTGAGGFGADIGADVAGAGLNPAADMAGGPAMTSPVQSAPVTQPVGTAPQVTAPTAVQPAVTDVASQSGNLGPVGAQAPVTPADYNVGGRFGPDNIDVGGGFNPASGAPQSSGSFFSKFLDFANNNKQLVNTGTQLIGGALKGAADTDMFNQKMGLARDQFNRANSVGTFAPTTGIIARAAQ